MRVSINVLPLCLLIACGLVLAACNSWTPTRAVDATQGEGTGTNTLVATPEEPPATKDTPTPERLSAVVETQNPPTATTPAFVTPAITESPYPAPVSQPAGEAPSSYPPPLPSSSTSYPPPVTPVANSNAYPGPSTPIANSNPYPGPSTPDANSNPYPGPSTPVTNSNAYPGPGTPVATPTPGSSSNVTATPLPAQTGPTPSPSNPTEASVPLPTPTLIPGTATQTPTPYVVRTGFRPSDPKTFVLAAGIPQLVEFYARWSSNSQIMAPVINALDVKYHQRMNFIYLDIDDSANNTFKQTLDFQYAPHFFLLDGQGNIIKQWTGWVKVEDLEAALQAVEGQ